MRFWRSSSEKSATRGAILPEKWRSRPIVQHSFLDRRRSHAVVDVRIVVRAIVIRVFSGSASALGVIELGE